MKVLSSTTLPVVVAQGQTEEAAIASRWNVVAVVPYSWPPQFAHGEEGEPFGFAIDVMNEIATREGITVTYNS